MLKALKKIGAWLKKYGWYLCLGAIILGGILLVRRRWLSWAWGSATGWKPGRRVGSRLDELDAAEKKLEENREVERKHDAAVTVDRTDEWKCRVRERREEAERKAKPPQG